MDSKKMSILYEDTLTELQGAVETALKVNDKLRARYDDLPMSVKEKIRMIEGDLLMILNRLPQIRY